jgi:hypothetical protein
MMLAAGLLLVYPLRFVFAVVHQVATTTRKGKLVLPVKILTEHNVAIYDDILQVFGRVRPGGVSSSDSNS